MKNNNHTFGIIPFLVYRKDKLAVVQMTYRDEATLDVARGLYTPAWFRHMITTYIEHVPPETLDYLGMDRVNQILARHPKGRDLVKRGKIWTVTDLAIYMAMNAKSFYAQRQENPMIDSFLRTWEKEVDGWVSSVFGTIEVACTEDDSHLLPGWEKKTLKGIPCLVKPQAHPESIQSAERFIAAVMEAQPEEGD